MGCKGGNQQWEQEKEGNKRHEEGRIYLIRFWIIGRVEADSQGSPEC